MVSLAELSYLPTPELRLQIQEAEDRYLDLQDEAAALHAIDTPAAGSRREVINAEVSRLKVLRARCNIAINLKAQEQRLKRAQGGKAKKEKGGANARP